MRLTQEQQSTIRRFREAVESYALRELFTGAPVRIDDEAVLASRFSSGPHVWYVLGIQPSLPQFHVGLVTDDPDRSRDFERMIEETGVTIREFVQLGFEAAGLVWRDPPVHHYRDRWNAFFFVTPVDVPSVDVLASPDVVHKAERMLRGYHLAFSGRVV